ncbi:hypothetical protein [Allostreptomyces psammosilenae]|uniref:Uncharacterized protein n=1 Tax=Allostreptomyces psammosilenae TaxID=1892865 RepID=A0A853A8K7_9ACTN|nr:hypothetical protein [Allostreptomyces psammosilenae]NYI06971.1 hypothetical protein [Allostreptomyces psammosilenae]
MSVPDHLRAHAARQPASPLEQVRSFLRGHVADTGDLGELRSDLARLAAVNTRGILQDLQALEDLLAAPPADGTLARLVAWDANWVLDDETSDQAAARWLGEVADLLREVLAEAQ